MNREREETKRHKNELEQRITEVRIPWHLYLYLYLYFVHLRYQKLLQVKASVKSQGGEGEDPDSRMDSERADRRDKKGGKGKVDIAIKLL